MASNVSAGVESSPDRPRRSWIGLVSGAQGPLVGLVLLCVVFAVSSPYFLSLRNALNVVDQVTVLGIMAIGMTAVIVIGGIDLSVGSILALSMMVMGWLSRGIDVGARAAIYEVIARLAKTGMAVIVVSSDLEEVLGLSHRVMVLSRGRQMGILDAAAATNVAVMELATA